MDELTFFFDRSVGLHDVPHVFRAAGRAHLAAIVRRAAEPGPFVDGIYADGLRPKWLPPEAG